MANDTMMKCRIKKLLTITPGSIAGQGSSITVDFQILSIKNCDELQATYKILGPGSAGGGKASFRFKQPSRFAKSKYGLNPGQFEATKSFKNPDLSPMQPGGYGQRLTLEPTPDYTGKEEATLKIVARVVGVGNAVLDPVHSIGSVAVLSTGLKKLMKEHFKDKMPAGQGKAFWAKAREFVKLKLDENSDLDLPGLDTVMAAIKGETDHRLETLTSMDKLIDKVKKGVTDQIPEALRSVSAER